jgi:phenol hydroxylase P5 protein
MMDWSPMSVRRVQIEPGGRAIECSEDQTILDACLRHSIWIAHACTRGTCGTCKADLESGTVDISDRSATCLTDAEFGKGRILLCSAVPKSDLVVRIDTPPNGGPQLYPVRDFSAYVVSIEECAQETRRIILELDQPLDFVAGQYITLRVPESNLRRSYSLANPPTDRRRIELHVRLTPGGEATDRWLFRSVELGDQVDVSGPYGSFLMRTDRLEPAIMIAGGTGLAPIKSMIRHVLERGHAQQMHLLHGARRRDDLYDVEFFSQLVETYPAQFDYTPCLSEERWEGAQGFVTDVLASRYQRARGHVAYVSGPRGMVEAATRALIAARVPSRDIYREAFYDGWDSDDLVG